MKTNIVYVKFGYNREYPYINNQFDLKVGDKVYVNGKCKDQIGTVIEVINQFKASIKHYKYVVQKINFDFHGKFTKCEEFFVSVGEDALPYEQVFSWIKGPSLEEEPGENEFLVCGNGYEIDLNDFDVENCELTKYKNLEDEYCFIKTIEVEFITVKNSVGKAFVYNDDEYSIVEFKIDMKTKKMSNIFCDCLSARLCFDIEAVAIAIITAIKKGVLTDDENFTIIESELFEKIIEEKDLAILI